MIPHDALINRIRDLGFKFKIQAPRVEIYKQKGTTTRVSVRRCDLHDEDYARTILHQAGLGEDDIERFIGQYKTNHIH